MLLGRVDYFRDELLDRAASELAAVCYIVLYLSLLACIRSLYRMSYCTVTLGLWQRSLVLAMLGLPRLRCCAANNCRSCCLGSFGVRS